MTDTYNEVRVRRPLAEHPCGRHRIALFQCPHRVAVSVAAKGCKRCQSKRCTTSNAWGQARFVEVRGFEPRTPWMPLPTRSVQVRPLLAATLEFQLTGVHRRSLIIAAIANGGHSRQRALRTSLHSPIYATPEISLASVACRLYERSSTLGCRRRVSDSRTRNGVRDVEACDANSKVVHPVVDVVAVRLTYVVATVDPAGKYHIREGSAALLRDHRHQDRLG